MKRGAIKYYILVGVICIGVFVFFYYYKSYHKTREEVDYPIYLSSEYYESNSFIQIDHTDISKLNKKNYVLFTYNNYCTFPISCESIFEKFMNEENIAFQSIPIEEFKKTSFYQEVKYAPSVMVISRGRIISYLDANSDLDLVKYQDVDEFRKWIGEYIYFDN